MRVYTQFSRHFMAGVGVVQAVSMLPSVRWPVFFFSFLLQVMDLVRFHCRQAGLECANSFR